MAILPWKKISSKLIFEHKWYRLRQDVVELPDGKVVDDYFVSERQEVVLVFPFTTEGKVVLVKQYKHASEEVLLELPGGVVERGELPDADAAARELREETGYTGDLIKISELIDNPTKDTNRIHVFLASNCTKQLEQELDETENIEVLEFDPDSLISMVANGTIKVSGSVAAIFLSLNYLNSLK